MKVLTLYEGSHSFKHALIMTIDCSNFLAMERRGVSVNVSLPCVFIARGSLQGNQEIMKVMSFVHFSYIPSLACFIWSYMLLLLSFLEAAMIKYLLGWKDVFAIRDPILELACYLNQLNNKRKGRTISCLGRHITSNFCFPWHRECNNDTCSYPSCC